ncbi:MAG: hypothetical protein MI746_16780 [Pseudomonadales bacterium]|nr:hypothetical protein [Pseudomonadales bacterium]
MYYRTPQFLAVILVSIFLASKLHAQDAYYNPFFFSPRSASNTFYPDQGQLRLSSIDVLPGNNTPQSLILNAVFQHQGDNLFELISVDELQPEQECTRAEINLAIPLLDFSMSLAEAEELIGCQAHLVRAQVDLVSGRLVLANWVGNDGFPNAGSGSFGGTFIGGGPTVWVPQGSPVLVSGNHSSPSITFALREGELESISYSLNEQSIGCQNEDMLSGFRNVSINDVYEDLVAALDCQGNLQQVVFDEVNHQQEYYWYSSAATYVPTPSPIPFRPPGNETIRASIIDNQIKSLNFYSTEAIEFTTNCTVEDLTAAAANVQVGQTAIDLAELLDCGPGSATLSIDASGERATYRWQTSNSNSSIFVSSNRSLYIAVTDGVVTAAQLSRF